MERLRASYFFDLSNFAHAALFKDCQFVWEALEKITPYLLHIQGSIEGKISPQAILVDPKHISIGPGSVVEAGAYIQGPCIIGRDCLVRQGAYIRGHAVLGDRCVVGHATEIKQAIFLNDAHAPHFNYVGDSILGNHVNLGAGTIIANLRFDQTHVKLHFEDKLIDTQRRKLGGILGDDSQTGCNSVIQPGSFLGKGCLVYPLAETSGFYPTKTRIVRR